ncbi:MAG: ECF transporter S component [Clostridiales bacterium]|nr:ECF transporter S component [Clostridiales bacterium]
MSENQKKEQDLRHDGSWIRKLTYGGLLLAIAVVLPQVFHLTGGPASGAVFLPMHIPVLIAGLLLGPLYGLAIGAIAPACSFLITQMPTAARLPFMIIELAIYGLVSGFLHHTLGLYRFRFPRRLRQENSDKPTFSGAERLIGIYASLILAMVAGRMAYALSLIVMGRLFGIENANPAAVVVAVTTGIVGIVIQLVVIPPIIFALQKGGLTNGLFKPRRPKA